MQHPRRSMAGEIGRRSTGGPGIHFPCTIRVEDYLNTLSKSSSGDVSEWSVRDGGGDEGKGFEPWASGERQGHSLVLPVTVDRGVQFPWGSPRGTGPGRGPEPERMGRRGGEGEVKCGLCVGRLVLYR